MKIFLKHDWKRADAVGEEEAQIRNWYSEERIAIVGLQSGTISFDVQRILHWMIIIKIPTQQRYLVNPATYSKNKCVELATWR